MRDSTLTAASDATAFTALPARAAAHHQSKSRSSSFSSPRPRRHPVVPRRPSPDDFQNLHDPFASARTSRTVALGAFSPSPTATAFNDGSKSDYFARPTRMSAWGALPPGAAPMVPPRPPPNVLVINPPARRLPSLRGLAACAPGVPSATDSGVCIGYGGASEGMGMGLGSDNASKSGSGARRSMSFFSYTTPSAYSQDGDTVDGFDAAFDVEEAMLAQKLLRRLDATANVGGGWSARSLKVKRNGSTASGYGRRS